MLYPDNGSILEVSKSARYATVDELFEKSRPSSIYYTLLVLSAFIIAPGLILNNAPIVIGGMLVTPLLSPVLVVALGLSVGDLRAIKNEVILILKSVLIMVAVYFLMGLIFGTPDAVVFENTLITALLYFIVAVASGMAATFAWSNKEVSEILPGVSIAVTLVPPLSLVGIWLSSLSLAGVEFARFFFLLFLFNLLGILAGSLVVFSLLKFQQAAGEVEKKAKEAEEE